MAVTAVGIFLLADPGDGEHTFYACALCEYEIEGWLSDRANSGRHGQAHASARARTPGQIMGQREVGDWNAVMAAEAAAITVATVREQAIADLFFTALHRVAELEEEVRRLRAAELEQRVSELESETRRLRTIAEGNRDEVRRLRRQIERAGEVIGAMEVSIRETIHYGTPDPISRMRGWAIGLHSAKLEVAT